MPNASPLTAAFDDASSASDRAYRLVRQAILDLTFEPGSALSESSLVDQIGVSRTPIRQALQRLEQEQLLRIFPQRGTIVAPLDMQGFRDALFTRLSLEASAAAEAALRASPQDCADLGGQVQRQREAVQRGEDAAFFALNDIFHRQIMAIAGVANVWTVVQSAKVHLDRIRAAHLMLTDPYPLEPVVEEHAGLVATLARNDAVSAAALMKTHIDMVVPRAELLFRRRPELFGWPPGIVSPKKLRSISTR